jgi:hypothetical protein
MMQAIMLEMRLMEPGKKENSTLQFGTARKLCATTTVPWEASPASGADIVMSAGDLKGRYIATLCPSECRWYETFSTGISARMGDIVHQDRAYTLAIMLAIVGMFEEQFQAQGYEMPIRDMEAVMFFIASCMGGFCGYETVWTDLGALQYDVHFSEEKDDYCAVIWPVTGRFKNDKGSWNHYMIPIAGVTRSGVRVFEWTQRVIKRLELIGRVDGWLFRAENGA